MTNDITSTEPDPSEVSKQVETLVSSVTFSRALRQQRLLRFVVDETLAGRKYQLKGSTIQNAVFPESTEDGIVPREASRLRAKLREYYDDEGPADKVRIIIKKGSYIPLFAMFPPTFGNRIEEIEVEQVVTKKLGEPFDKYLPKSIPPAASDGELGGITKTITILLQHRSTHYQRLENALNSGQDILWLTGMSENTIKHLKPLLDRTRGKGSRLRVLTWYPLTPSGDLSLELIESYRRHLDENSDKPLDTVEQVRNAAEAWCRFASGNPDMEIRRYQSSPTMQGFLVNGPGAWGLIELLPFATHPQDRPALLLDCTHGSQVFSVFQKALETLWKRSQPFS